MTIRAFIDWPRGNPEEVEVVRTLAPLQNSAYGNLKTVYKLKLNRSWYRVMERKWSEKQGPYYIKFKGQEVPVTVVVERRGTDNGTS